MIVKIQRPLMTNGDEPMAFVYNKDRLTINAMIPYFEVEELFVAEDGEEPPSKVYHEAALINGNLEIGERVEDQDW